jgi:hypothetical protein
MKAKTKKAPSVKSKAVKPPKRVKQPRDAPAPAKGNATNIIMTTLTVGAAGVMGYFGWQYYKKKKAAKNYNLDNEILKIHPTPADTTHHTTDTYTPPVIIPETKGGGKTKKNTVRSGNDEFPLKKGSKGDKVRQLQQALIDKYGSSILPKYGADADFGSETQNALKKKGLAITVSESTFNVITQGGGEGSTSTSAIVSLGEKLYKAATAKNLNSVLSLLKSINNKDDYQQVSNSFMQYRLHGVRQTLVNGLLGSFSSEDQKQKIRFEFIRMGLQYNGNKWSLSGFDGQAIVTKEAATVWITATQSVQVPALMVLGNEVAKRLDFTLFENNNKYFLIKTQAIKYL